MVGLAKVFQLICRTGEKHINVNRHRRVERSLVLIPGHISGRNKMGALQTLVSRRTALRMYKYWNGGRTLNFRFGFRFPALAADADAGADAASTPATATRTRFLLSLLSANWINGTLAEYR